MSERYIKIETAISVVFNAVLSAAFAWFGFRGVSEVPLMGAQGMVVDLLPTTFMITFMTANIETLLTRKRMRAGTLAPLLPAPGAWAWLPRPWLWRALVLALLATAVAVPAMAGLFLLLGIEGLPFHIFVVYKLVYSALLALLVTPLILRLALGDRID